MMDTSAHICKGGLHSVQGAPRLISVLARLQASLLVLGAVGIVTFHQPLTAARAAEFADADACVPCA